LAAVGGSALFATVFIFYLPIYMKPLGGKSYGSIPHLLGSKLGEGDHHCHEGQHKIATEKVRDKHDFVIVQEKYDGSNVAVAKLNGQVIALTRRGYTAESSPFEQHHFFAKWVADNFNRFNLILEEGDRICGEWLVQAHGLKYEIHVEPFVAFDYFSGKERLILDEFRRKIGRGEFYMPRLLSFGNSPISIAAALERLNSGYRYLLGDETETKSLDLPEGLIYRIERAGKVDFMAKYVRNDFETGKYLTEISGHPTVWNYDISLFL
jgi:hypothetical protein